MNNVEQFNLLTGYLLAELYGTFPRYTEIEFDSFVLDKIIDEDDREGAFAWDDTVRSTVLWLSRAGYIWLESGGISEESACATLSPAGLELLKSTPEILGAHETIGEKLKGFAAERVKGGMQEFVSQIITLGISRVLKE